MENIISNIRITFIIAWLCLVAKPKSLFRTLSLYLKYFISDTTHISKTVQESEILVILTTYMMSNILFLSLPRRSHLVRKVVVVVDKVTCMYCQPWFIWLYMLLIRKFKMWLYFLRFLTWVVMTLNNLRHLFWLNMLSICNFKMCLYFKGSYMGSFMLNN